MSCYVKRVIIHLHADETYTHILEFIKILQRRGDNLRVELVSSEYPSRIKVKSRNGLLEILINPEEERSVVKFNFNFKWLRRLYVALSVGIIGFTLLGIFLDPRHFGVLIGQILILVVARERAKLLAQSFINEASIFLQSRGIKISQPKI